MCHAFFNWIQKNTFFVLKKKINSYIKYEEKEIEMVFQIASSRTK